MVRKLHKVSEKPASTLGFWTPGAVSKESPPHRGVARCRAANKWQVASGKWQNRGPRGTETVQTLV